MHHKNVLLCFCFVLKISFDSTVGILHEYKNPYFHYPYGGPFMGILAAFALPLRAPVPGDVFISVNFEASYSLPENQTDFQWPPIVSTETRQLLYSIFEKKLKSHGYPGKPCLLRAICESAEYSSSGTGILGDLVYLILTPSSSLNTNLTKDYQEAELYARKKRKCKKYKRKCHFSILSMFSWIGNLLGKNKVNKTLI